VYCQQFGRLQARLCQQSFTSEGKTLCLEDSSPNLKELDGRHVADVLVRLAALLIMVYWTVVVQQDVVQSQVPVKRTRELSTLL